MHAHARTNLLIRSRYQLNLCSRVQRALLDNYSSEGLKLTVHVQYVERQQIELQVTNYIVNMCSSMRLMSSGLFPDLFMP